MSTRVVDHR